MSSGVRSTSSSAMLVLLNLPRGLLSLTSMQLPVFSGIGVFETTPIPEKTGSSMEVRLNSPRGKFKITNMADDQVDLTPEDIFGASFIEKEI